MLLWFFNAKGGAQGVGMSTTYSVVSSSILILLMNYILTSLFLIYEKNKNKGQELI